MRAHWRRLVHGLYFSIVALAETNYRHTASRLAEEGATVIVHGRREATVREAIDFVKGHGGDDAKVEGIVADVSSLRGMNELCDEVLARTDRLDCLVNNAGECQYVLLLTGTKSAAIPSV